MDEYPMIFVGRDTRWEPLEGCDAPEGLIAEVRSVPGNVVAWGHSRSEALSRLEEALNFFYLQAGGRETWYQQALESMTEEDREEASMLASIIFWNQKKNRELREARKPVVVVDEQELCPA